MTPFQWRLICRVLRAILSFLVEQREGITYTPSRSTWEYNRQSLKMLDDEVNKE